MAWITLTLKSLWESRASVSPLLSEKQASKSGRA